MNDRLKFYAAFIQEEIYLVEEKPVPDTPLTLQENESENPESTEVKTEPGILVLFLEETQNALKDGDRDFLSKILTAVNYSLEKVEFYNIREQSIDAVRTTINNSQAPYLLAFGVEATAMELENHPELYHPQSLGTRTLLLADALDVISKDQSRKRLLWNALKKMF